MGKSFAYGAQRGLFLIQGNADARAGIRLSGADMVLGGEPAPRSTTGWARSRPRQLQGLRVRVHDRRPGVVLGDPGPGCTGMTGGVVYVRQNPDWGLDESAVRRRLRRRRRSASPPLEESDAATVAELLGAYRRPSRGSGQDGRRPTRLQALIDDPAEHFVAIIPVTQQADPNISTE